VPESTVKPEGKRERILDAAYRVCERRGVEGARMEEVAALAQVSKGTLYRYFESKEELLLATILDSYEQSLGFHPKPFPDTNAREQLDALSDYLVLVLEQITPRMRVHYQAWGIVTARPELGERLYGFLSRFHAERDAQLRSILIEGRHAGVVRTDVDLEAVVGGVQALLSGFLYRATFEAEQVLPALFRRSLEVLLCDVFIENSPDGVGDA
jgi:TetR/AcrR family transcriptional regulator